jgi:hypothetical protein
MVKVEDRPSEEKKESITNNSTEKKGELIEKLRGNLWIVSTIALGLVVLILLVSNFTGITGNVTKDTASDNLMKFLAENAPSEVTLLDTSSESGLYKVNVEYQGETIPVYVTKDGKYLASLQPLTPTTTTPTTTTEIPKTNKPKVDLYVMSFCPYGNQAENTMLPVYNLLKDKVEWNIHYIVSVSGSTISSLHGQPEVDENEREACVLKNYGMAKWWAFTTYVNNNCGSDGSCWETAATKSSMEVSNINDCVSKNGLSLMKANADASNSAGASGSPTLIINGVESTAVYQYGNSEAYKAAICSAFTTSPDECLTALAASTAGSSASGSC